MNLIVPPSGFSFRSSSVAPASLQLCSLPLSSLLELPPFLFPPSTQGLCCSLRSSDDVHPFFLSLLLTSHRSYINDSRHVAGSLLHAFKTADSLGVASAPNALTRVVSIYLTRLTVNITWWDIENLRKSLQLGKFIPSLKDNWQETDSARDNMKTNSTEGNSTKYMRRDKK